MARLRRPYRHGPHRRCGRGADRRPFLGRLYRRLRSGRPDPLGSRAPGWSGAVAADVGPRGGPMVSFLPRATRLRADLACLSTRDEVTMGRCHGTPVTVAPLRCVIRWPSAGGRRPFLRKALAAGGFPPPSPRRSSQRTQAVLRWKLFELHFQYLNAFDNLHRAARRSTIISASTAGPLNTLGCALLRTAHPSKSRIETPREQAHRHRRMTQAPDLPPKPHRGGTDRVSLWRYNAECFGKTSSRPSLPRLYRAWMAEFSHAVLPLLPRDTQPALIDGGAQGPPDGFPPNPTAWAEGLRPLLGRSRVPDQWRGVAAPAPDHRPPAFEGGETTPARQPFRRMWGGGAKAAVARIGRRPARGRGGHEPLPPPT